VIECEFRVTPLFFRLWRRPKPEMHGQHWPPQPWEVASASATLAKIEEFAAMDLEGLTVK